MLVYLWHTWFGNCNKVSNVFSERIANKVQHWQAVRLLGIAHAPPTFALGQTAGTVSESPEK
jgi:hypothetical protein